MSPYIYLNSFAALVTLYPVSISKCCNPPGATSMLGALSPALAMVLPDAWSWKNTDTDGISVVSGNTFLFAPLK
jgi:hypothetical protein